jgi:7,8-dihydroneopterin aldolase/epimerase/oxygenase
MVNLAFIKTSFYMLVIHLEKMQFFAYHGWYPEERTKGNQFEVSLNIEAEIPEKVTLLEDTLDYVKVFEVVAGRMSIPTPLLETLAAEIAEAVYKLDERVNAVSITIKKLSAPIKDFNGTVGITYKKDFKQ